MDMSRSQQVFTILLLVSLIILGGALGLALRPGPTRAVERSQPQIVEAQGTLMSEYDALRATVESVGASVSTLQANVSTVEALGNRLAVLEVEMAASEASNNEQATEVAGLVEQFYAPEPPRGVVEELLAPTQSPLDSWPVRIAILLVVVMAAGLLAATVWGGRGGRGGDPPGPPRSDLGSPSDSTRGAYRTRSAVARPGDGSKDSRTRR